MTRREFRNFLFDFLNTRFGLFLSYIHRTQSFLRFELPHLFGKIAAIWRSREFVNFTYLLSDDARQYLPYFTASLVGCSVAEAETVIQEIENDRELSDYYADTIKASYRRLSSDENFKPGRLLLHYALVRLTKPRLVFEAGLDKGFGSIIMNRALLRNREEGYKAGYIGVEYRADRPVFLFESYPDQMGQIRYARWSDQFVELEKNSVDFLFYDAVENDEELERFSTYSDRLSDQAMIVSAWSSPAYFRAAELMGREVSIFHAKSKRHWFPGSNLSIIHQRKNQRIQFQSH